MQRQSIIVDLDGVLFDVVNGFVQRIIQHFDVALDIHKLAGNLFAWLEACVPDAVLKALIQKEMIRILQGDNVFYANLPIYPGAMKAINLLAERYHLAALTSRPTAVRKGTMLAVARHFPGITNISHSRRKGTIAKSIRAFCALEDNPETVEEYARKRIHVFYVRHPWSRDVRGSRHVHEVSSALQAAEQIMELTGAVPARRTA